MTDDFKRGFAVGLSMGKINVTFGTVGKDITRFEATNMFIPKNTGFITLKQANVITTWQIKEDIEV